MMVGWKHWMVISVGLGVGIGGWGISVPARADELRGHPCYLEGGCFCQAATAALELTALTDSSETPGRARIDAVHGESDLAVGDEVDFSAGGMPYEVDDALLGFEGGSGVQGALPVDGDGIVSCGQDDALAIEDAIDVALAEDCFAALADHDLGGCVGGEHEEFGEEGGDAGMNEPVGGCGCSTAPPTAVPLGLVLLALGRLRRRGP